MNNDGKDKEVCASVRIKARLLWIAPDTAFKEAQRVNPFETNQFLITVSLLKVNINDPKLPRTGDVVMLTPYKFAVYRNSCQ
ncbi:hypothetical protein PHMEG_00040649, partial [Phytophthora megakarya]